MAVEATAEAFTARLHALASPAERGGGSGGVTAPARAPTTLVTPATSSSACAWATSSGWPKEFVNLPPDQTDQLLASPIHEVRRAR